MNQTQRTSKRDGKKPPATGGLNELDQDRAASVADEGGATAATLESQEPATQESSPPRNTGARRRDRANRRH